MMGIMSEAFRYKFQEFLFNLRHGFAGGNPGAVGYPKDMGVYGDRGLAKGRIQNNIGRFSSHARQSFQVDPVFRDLALVFLDQDLTGADNVPSLAVKQAYGFDVGLKPLFSEGQDGFRSVGDGKQLCRRLVHTLVRRLCRQGYRHQLLKRISVVELRSGFRILLLQTLENLQAFCWVHWVLVWPDGVAGRPHILANSS